MPRLPRLARPTRSASTGSSRSLVFPSPVVVLSVAAVAFAAIVFVLTRHSAPAEQEITPVEGAPTSQTPASSHDGSGKGHHPKKKHHAPAVDRGKVFVEVFNNSGITGLAGRVGQQAGDAGWKVVGTDNWYGSIPTTTVYYPQRLATAAKQLALDLGIRRTAPAVDPMKLDRLTVILTGPLASTSH